LDQKTKAIRATDVERVLDNYRSPTLGNRYRSTLPAGRFVRLLVAIQGQDVIKNPILEALAYRELGIDSLSLHNTYIPQFQDWGYVRVYDDRIEEEVRDRDKMLQTVGSWWEKSDPHPAEAASLELFHETALSPRLASDVESIRNSVPASAWTSALDHLSETALVDHFEHDGKKWFYSPEIFGENYPKAVRFIAHAGESREKIAEMVKLVDADQGIPHSIAQGQVGKGLWDQVTGAGLVLGYPITIGATTETFYYTPQVRSRFEREGRGDKFDLIKTGMSHWQFAHRLAQPVTGKLKYSPKVFLDRLIERGRAGDCTAIGTDFQLLIDRGLIMIEPTYGSRYRMVLPDSKEKIADLEAMRDAFGEDWFAPKAPFPDDISGIPGEPKGQDSLVYRSRKSVAGKGLAQDFLREMFDL
jgi:hypothetical protein